MKSKPRGISRRQFVAACGAANLVSGALWQPGIAAAQRGPSRWQLPLDTDWSFGGNGRQSTGVTLPHCVAKLSWQDWDPAAWQNVWQYRRHFSLPGEFRNRRAFLQFDGVMVGASPAINGHALPEHLGGYLPFRYEITDWLTAGDNVLTVAVD